MTLKARVDRMAAANARQAGPGRPIRHMVVEADETEAESYFRHYGEALTPEEEARYFIIAVLIVEPGPNGGLPVARRSIYPLQAAGPGRRDRQPQPRAHPIPRQGTNRRPGQCVNMNGA
jgi:hypothetical protein